MAIIMAATLGMSSGAQALHQALAWAQSLAGLPPRVLGLLLLTLLALAMWCSIRLSIAIVGRKDY